MERRADSPYSKYKTTHTTTQARWKDIQILHAQNTKNPYSTHMKTLWEGGGYSLQYSSLQIDSLNGISHLHPNTNSRIKARRPLKSVTSFAANPEINLSVKSFRKLNAFALNPGAPQNKYAFARVFLER